MNVTLNELLPPGDEPFEMPFSDTSDDGFTPAYWADSFFDDETRFFHVLNGGFQAARISIVRVDVDHLKHYAVAPELQGTVVRIRCVEVISSLRGRGIGRSIVSMILEMTPNAQFVAVSHPDAEGFWTKLGWSRHAPEDPAKADYMKLSIAPLRVRLR